MNWHWQQWYFAVLGTMLISSHLVLLLYPENNGGWKARIKSTYAICAQSLSMFVLWSGGFFGP